MHFGNLNIQKPFHFTVEEKVLLNQWLCWFEPTWQSRDYDQVFLCGKTLSLQGSELNVNLPSLVHLQAYLNVLVIESAVCEATSGQMIYSVTSLRVARVLWSIAACLVSSLLSPSRPLTRSAVSLNPSTSFTRKRISLSRLAMQTLLLSKLDSWISA